MPPDCFSSSAIAVVIGGRRDDGDIVKVLGGGPNHGRAADVDVLDQFLEFHAWLGGGLFESVEIDDDHVDRQDSVLGDGGAVCGILAAVQDSAVNFGMQCLDAAVEHFGEAGEFGDIFDGDAGVAQQLGGATGRDQFDAHARQLAREIGEAGFVGDAEKRAFDTGRHAVPRTERM